MTELVSSTEYRTTNISHDNLLISVNPRLTILKQQRSKTDSLSKNSTIDVRGDTPKPKQTAKKKSPSSRVTTRKKVPPKPLFTEQVKVHAQRGLWLALEVIALTSVALIAVIAALGRATDKFSGVALWSSLVPFSAVVLILAVLLFLAFHLWIIIRKPTTRLAPYIPAVIASAMALGIGWLASGDEFRDNLGQLRSLVGGAQQAERTTLSHQVYATYRRANLAQMQILLDRAQQYEATIKEAADSYGVSAEVMIGLGATESSFLPRDSKDGGRGLFQITSPPKIALEQVTTQLGEEPLDWRNPRHNALLAAATWRHYLQEMKGDLFLSLLAYNIGPKNGGLLSIMNQYGAKDFATIQPYLQDLPRDYPIRVLTAALASRLYKAEGELLRYEEDGNAKRIQALGIPGLDAG